MLFLNLEDVLVGLVDLLVHYLDDEQMVCPIVDITNHCICDMR